MKLSEDERAEKFKCAANRRVRNVETTLRRVRNLSNTASYAYSDQEVDRIFEHLQDALDRTRDSFVQRRQQEQFSL